MSPSTLGHVTLGYQMVWGRKRQPVAVQLFVDDDPAEPVDAAHFLRILEQTWTEQGPRLIICAQSARLAGAMLHCARADTPWLVVQDEWLANPILVDELRQAQRRGAQVLWRGQEGNQPASGMDDLFARRILTLSPGEALRGLHASMRQGQAGGSGAAATNSPIQRDQIYESVPGRALVDLCLDDSGAWGVAGWPTDDVLQAFGGREIAPAQRSIRTLVAQTDADAALELIERTLGDEPILAYRYLQQANSAALGLRVAIESLRNGLMVLGLSTFKQWLLGQLPSASTEVDLDPVRATIVLRARLMEALMDAGEEETLRREVFLCGILSQIDQMLGEPVADALQRIPLSERVSEAILAQTGPYAPFLELASALELANMGVLREVCESHGFEVGDVNRTLLRVLSQVHPSTAGR